ncbi:TlpA disulfide reductase family protein [Nocardioides sp. R-C-SC26]|uniref:TlpA family protein disulfide reductase n=1 Tax=Nocardioides sp. R-C-SC26 TaxID=2870414 RepID=UPI001E5D9151|nr:TlpA disulfide reductase family protein [Nocardioides sp. R-C-SC26]
MTGRRGPRRGSLIAGAAVVVSVALTGCSGLQGTEDANFVTGAGSIVPIPESERPAPLDFTGTSLGDEPIDVTDYRGEVVVVNFWGSWCNPCRAEMPMLREASENLDAEFLGVLVRDESADDARAFEREFGITYPTIADSTDALLNLGRYAPQSPPSTVVLDREGRVAVLINGEIPSAGTLEDVITDVIAESSESPESGDGGTGG